MNGLAKNERKKRRPFIITMVVMCALFFLRDNMGVPIPLVIYLMVSCLGICFFRREDFAVFGACITLFSHGVQTYYILLFGIVVYLFKYLNQIKNFKPFVLVMLLMVLELVHGFIEPFNMVDYIRDCVSYCFLGIVLCDIKSVTNKQIVFLLKTFVFTYCFTMFDILGQLVKQAGSLGGFFTKGIRFGNLNAGNTGAKIVSLYDNENMIALFSLIAISACMVLIFIEQKNKILWMIMCTIALFFGFSTFSKAFILVLPILFFMVIVVLVRDDRISAAKRLLLLIVVIGLIFIALNTVYSSAIENIIGRFKAGDLTSGRSELFSQYNQFFYDHPQFWLTGIGLQSLKEKTGISNTPHNGIQEMIICFGMIGTILWGAIFINILSSAKKARGRRAKLLNFIPAAALIVYTQSIQFVRISSIYMQLILIAYALSARYEYADKKYIAEDTLDRGAKKYEEISNYNRYRR